MAQPARSGGRPIAASTCDGPIRPDEQAAPTPTATPARSSAISCSSPARPGVIRQLMLGSRAAPRRRRSRRRGDARAPRPRAASRRPRPRPSRSRARTAAAKPTMPGRLGVPARRRPSCPPPRCSRRAAPGPARSTSAPTPGGPPSLCADRLTRSAPSSARVQGSLPNAWAASQCSSAAGRVHEPGDLGDRLHHAGLVVGQHHRDEAGPLVAPSRSRQRRQVDHAVGRRPGCGVRRHGLEHAGMLGRADQLGAGKAQERQVVGLGAAAGEDDPVGRHAPCARRSCGASAPAARAHVGPARAARKDCPASPAPRPSPPPPPGGPGMPRRGRDRPSGGVRPGLRRGAHHLTGGWRPPAPARAGFALGGRRAAPRARGRARPAAPGCASPGRAPCCRGWCRRARSRTPRRGPAAGRSAGPGCRPR